jgi:hypothetical protein
MFALLDNRGAAKQTTHMEKIGECVLRARLRAHFYSKSGEAIFKFAGTAWR